MALNSSGLNLAADGVAAGALWGSLHDDTPSPGGSNEVSGGGYSRVAINWDSADGGVVELDNGPLAFSGPASTEVTHFGLWTSDEGGQFLGSEALTGDLSFNASGELNVTPTITATTD